MATLRKDAEQSAPAKANGYTVLIAISILLNSTWSSRSFHQHFPPKILIRGSRPFRGFPMSRWRRWIPTTWWPPATPSTAASIRSTSSRRAWGPRPASTSRRTSPAAASRWRQSRTNHWATWGWDDSDGGFCGLDSTKYGDTPEGCFIEVIFLVHFAGWNLPVKSEWKGNLQGEHAFCVVDQGKFHKAGGSGWRPIPTKGCWSFCRIWCANRVRTNGGAIPSWFWGPKETARRRTCRSVARPTAFSRYSSGTKIAGFQERLLDM